MSEGAPPGKPRDLSDDLDLLEQLLSEEGVEVARDEHALRPRDASARVPLSFSQEMLWLLDQASPGLTAYNNAVARRISGALDLSALERSLSAIAARHEVLRTRFGLVDGEPSQLVDPPAPIRVDHVDLSGGPDGEREEALQSELRARARRPFNLANEHLFRVTLIRMSPTDHVLLIETHHAISDGWSQGLIMRELAAFYRAERRGTAPDLPALRFQFGDYAIWQRATLQGERLENLLSFWRTQLDGAREPLALPTDFPPQAPPSFAGAGLGADISPESLARIKAFGREHDATLYMILLASYATVLHRYTGRMQVLIGSGIANRPEHGTESLIGYFNNTLVQRADFSGDPTFAELLARVQGERARHLRSSGGSAREAHPRAERG